tara:strand:- start:541 stop:762 length:222 start_codon:yes stop_codon:yes gene_type:complete
MKVGDLVIRTIPPRGTARLATAIEQKERLGMGLVLSKYAAGTPAHPCVSVYYPKVGKIYDIAESLMEVISASR